MHTPIIDIDAHAEPDHHWLDEFPALRAALPPMLPADQPMFPTGSASPKMFSWFVASDLLGRRAPGNRLTADDLCTPVIELMYDPNRPAGMGFEGADMHTSLDAPKRIEWMNANGIAVQNLISGTAYTLYRFLDDPRLAMDAVSAVNTWMIDHVGEHIDRLKPVATVRFDDMDRAIGELERVRTAGCRAFLVPGGPVGDIPPYHPSFDRLWSAATDLGMIPILHVGMGPAAFDPGWGNTDDPSIAKRIATGMSYQAAIAMLNGMIFGGVFDRHPNLTLVITEFGIEWLPFVAHNISGRGAAASPLLGDYTLSMSPDEFIARNVRISPLPVPYQSPVPYLAEFPTVPIFSSDYPHYEAGSPSPVEHYDIDLADVDPAQKAAFLGGNINECYTRMGDALV